MSKALIIGIGFSANIHREALEMLGYDVIMIDDSKNISSVIECISSGKYDIVSLCNSPYYRRIIMKSLASKRYAYELPDKLVIEKPIVRPNNDDIKVYKDLISKYNEFGKSIIPVHNYIYQKFFNNLELPLEVVILRNGPHKGWYVNPKLTGGGILLDHGYHWLYIYDELGGNLNNINIIIDKIPDFTAKIISNDFKAYLTWEAPMRMTVINGKFEEPRDKKEQIMSIYNLIKDEQNHQHLVSQSLRVMNTLKNTYEKYSYMMSRDCASELL